MNKDFWDVLILMAYRSRLLDILVVIAILAIMGLAAVVVHKLRSAVERRRLTRTLSNKPSAAKAKGHSTREWITVGEYSIYVHRVVEQLRRKGPARERVIYVEVEYENRTGQESLSCRRNQWHLYARDGYSYEAESPMMADDLYTEKPYFGGERYINPGMNARGWLAFKAASDAEIVLLQFITAFLRTRTADIRIETAIEREAPMME